jgi:hypothetical protein
MVIIINSVFISSMPQFTAKLAYSGTSRIQHILFSFQTGFRLTWAAVLEKMLYSRYIHSSRGSSVSIVSTAWTTGRSEFDHRPTQKDFSLASVSRPGLVPTQPPVQWVPGLLSPGLKLGWGPGRDADHSPPSSAEVKNE